MGIMRRRIRRLGDQRWSFQWLGRIGIDNKVLMEGFGSIWFPSVGRHANRRLRGNRSGPNGCRMCGWFPVSAWGPFRPRQRHGAVGRRSTGWCCPLSLLMTRLFIYWWTSVRWRRWIRSGFTMEYDRSSSSNDFASGTSSVTISFSCSFSSSAQSDVMFHQ